MQRKVKDLQDAINTIHIREAMRMEIVQNVKTGTKRKKHRFFNAAAAVLVALLFGSLSIPASALVHSLVQTRMEEVPEEELKTLVDDVYRQQVEEDSTSRPYTEEEKARWEELYAKYREGTFPEGELMQVESVEEAERLEFCYLVPNSMFYLPDRELTEEEMLQIIDFSMKRNYALGQHYEEEYGDEIARLEQEKKEIVEKSGITEEKAIVIAKEWILENYGVSGEGLECVLNFSENILIADKTLFYHVTCEDTSKRQTYSIFIDIEDGSIARARGYDESREKRTFVVAEANALLPELEQNAVSFAKEQLQFAYEDIYVAYYSVDDVLNPTVSFYFVREDNSAFILEYSWDGTFGGYLKSQFSTYREEYENMKDSVETLENYEHKGEEIEIHIFFEKIEGESRNCST